MSQQIRDHLTANSYIKKKDIIIGNFLGGLAWALGSVIGATIVVAILFSMLKTINFIPIVGSFIGGVMDQIDQTRLNK